MASSRARKRGPAELHVHDIHAGDEEDDDDRAEHGVHDLASVADR